MERRHEEALMARLEEAASQGCAHIATGELHQWYGVKKLAAGTWRDLASRWNEVVASVRQFQPNFREPGQLMSVNGKNGMFLFGEKLVERVNPD